MLWSAFYTPEGNYKDRKWRNCCGKEEIFNCETDLKLVKLDVVYYLHGQIRCGFYFVVVVVCVNGLFNWSILVENSDRKQKITTLFFDKIDLKTTINPWSIHENDKYFKLASYTNL